MVIQLFTEELELCGPGHPERDVPLNNLAVALHDRYLHSRAQNDLERAIELYTEALEFHPRGHHAQDISLDNLANALRDRYQHSRAQDDLERAIDLNTEALELRPAGHHARDISLVNLASALCDRYQHSQAQDDLERAIDLNTEALDLCPPGHHARDISLVNLAVALCDRYQHSQAQDDLERAIELHTEALELRPPGHHARDISLVNLANALHDRYQHSQAQDDLERAIDLNTEALELRPAGHHARDISLVNLASALCDRYQHSQAQDDLERAIDLNTEALDLCPPGHHARDISLVNLAVALCDRYQHSRALDDLERAIDLNTEALELRPAGHHAQDISLVNLANALHDRYQHSQAQDDLERAIELHTEALELRPPGHHARDISLVNLAVALRDRYQHSRALDDLERAIDLYKEALELRPAGHHARDISLVNLASALRDRYQHSRAQDDLERAIELHTEALELCPPSHHARDISLNNLASALHDRYLHSQAQNDLERAIELYTKALELHPPGHHARDISLGNLARALGERYQHSRAQADLERAIDLFTQVLDLHPPGHHARDISLQFLAVALHDRYLHSQAQNDLERAIGLHTEALELRPAGHPYRAYSLLTLAVTLESTKESVSSRSNMIKLVKEGSEDPFSLPNVALHCAHLWVRWSVGIELQDAYQSFLNLLGHYLALGPTMKDQYSSLISQAGFLSIPMNVAAQVMQHKNTENVKMAVEWLDAGRSLLWSQSQRLSATLPSSEMLSHELNEKFTSTCHELQNISNEVDKQNTSALTSTIGSHPMDSKYYNALLSRRRKLLEEFDRLVHLIQHTPGCENYLKPLSFDKLKVAANEGPVIIVNCSSHHSDVIIVLANEPPRVIELGKSFMDEAQEIYSLYITARQEAKLSKSSKVLGQKLFTITKWLWSSVVKKVVVELQNQRVDKGSRIWWCPTSVLTTLPFHAAGNGREYVMDYYVSSYTPTLKALVDARLQPTASDARTPEMLIVAQTQDTRLPSAGRELSVINSITDHLKPVVLENHLATSESVMESLPSCHWAHFISHGEVSSASPFESSLHLFNGNKLTLNDIIKAHLPNAQFAFLAACHTAEQNESELHDEILHLAGAMQFSGFRSVIGTLWEMKDKDGPDVAQMFYEELLKGDESMDKKYTRAASALRLVTLKMKNTLKRVEMDRWVNFVHIGA
ncbi:hypothetical protein EYR36_002074 [Pleurotus pulmonarius]|nr:hypothetical protein EYR36_002074 [Pleurotus pulmonarius]KAF4588187.1 hypothetical protein EYR38_010154 [Pleurotus pulmonarius]